MYWLSGCKRPRDSAIFLGETFLTDLIEHDCDCEMYSGGRIVREGSTDLGVGGRGLKNRVLIILPPITCCYPLSGCNDASKLEVVMAATSLGNLNFKIK